MGLTVSRQKWLFVTVNDEKCRLILTGFQKVTRHSSVAFCSISADRHYLLALEKSSSKLEKQFSSPGFPNLFSSRPNPYFNIT